MHGTKDHKEVTMKRLLIFTMLSFVFMFFPVREGVGETMYQNARVLDGGSYAVNSVTFSPDGKLLASGNSDATICLWETVTGNKVDTLRGHTSAFLVGNEVRYGSVNSVAFSPDGNMLASGGLDGVILWNVATREKVKSLGAHSINSVAFSPDGKTFMSGGNSIILWDVATGEKLKEFQGHSRTVNALIFGNEGKWLATGSADRTIVIWDATTGNRVYTLDGRSRAVQSIDISPDGKMLASGGNYPNIVLWDLTNGMILKLVPTFQRSMVLAVKFSSDGKTLISSYLNGNVDIWDIKTGSGKKQLSSSRNTVNSLAFSPDGKMLASGDSKGKIMLWNVETKE
jgi:WD40 repeat protein